MISLSINGSTQSLGDIDPETPLLWALRDTLGLVGTKYGCGIAQCGACTVHLNGVPVRACQLQVGNLEGQDITTIEGVASADGTLHALQEAWIEHDVPQCGYCQAGQIMSAAALLAANTKPNDDDINAAMAGNICRCGTYTRIVEAIHTAAGKLDQGGTA
ncbi:MAG: (2Fe-2S)-binding protein [Arenicellaceae bacterium]|jgi:isoquinoline 1-oxidoreductase alpha subunit|nr:(2Fe-2S)-binding protein [Arenicellaceae bacterium]|tara:strand:- start:221 stop:700 length:480 start_codon:yes stop_codon:yes gene_type:complete